MLKFKELTHQVDVEVGHSPRQSFDLIDIPNPRAFTNERTGALHEDDLKMFGNECIGCSNCSTCTGCTGCTMCSGCTACSFSQRNELEGRPMMAQEELAAAVRSL
jgi:hypothetical protein